MPLMREWTEITVEEGLLPSVVRELLDMAVNPNHVEVVYGTAGRVILAEVHLAEHWYQERLKQQNTQDLPLEDFQTLAASEVVAQSSVPVEDAAQSNILEADEVGDVAQSTISDVVETGNVAQSSIVKPSGYVVVPPVKRGPGRPRKEPLPSASPDGEEP